MTALLGLLTGEASPSCQRVAPVNTLVASLAAVDTLQDAGARWGVVSAAAGGAAQLEESRVGIPETALSSRAMATIIVAGGPRRDPR
jgi:hypothetical protein